MEKNEFKILFLDDEIFSKEDPDNPAIIAWEELKENGYNVEVTDKMSEVIDAYYKDFYHLYILDIDMGKVDDIFDGNGATVGEFLRRMSSISNVVVYSARGKVADWLKAANFHFTEYVHKEQGELGLLTAVDKVFAQSAQKKIKIPTFDQVEHDDLAIAYYQDCIIPKEFVERQIPNLKFMEMKEIISCLQTQKPSLVLIMFANMPGMHEVEEFEQQLNQITMQQPTPNVVICVNASSNDRRILKLVNARPFRILNLESATFEDEFVDAIHDGVFWYGEEEIFDFPEDNKLFRKPMTQSEIEALRPDEWKYDYWGEDDEVDVEDYEEENEDE